MLCFFYLRILSLFFLSLNFIFVVLKKQIEIFVAICFIFNSNLFYLQGLYTFFVYLRSGIIMVRPGMIMVQRDDYQYSCYDYGPAG